MAGQGQDKDQVLRVRKRTVDGEAESLAVFEIQPGKPQLESVVAFQGLERLRLPSAGL